MTQTRIFERANFRIGSPPHKTLPNALHDADGRERASKEAEDKTQPARHEDAPEVTSHNAPFWRRLDDIPYKKRGALLAAAIAVPAMAAPGDFGALPADASNPSDDFATRQMVDAALPFERPGQSFPGSGFYYLGDPPEDALIALPTTDAFDTGAEGARELGAAIDAGAPARPFFSSAAGQGHNRALTCLAQAIWYEAASESVAGQRAVAQVVLNRVAHSSWPGSVCGVVYEGSQRRTGCQFSFTCDGSLSRRARGGSWETARRIASEALSGSVYAPIGHATHYHTLWVNPYWASSLDHVGTIGAHRFYRNRGSAGEKSAFTGSYAGFEPGVSGQTTPPSPNALDSAITGGSGIVPAPAGTGTGAAAGAQTPAATAANEAAAGGNTANANERGTTQPASRYSDPSLQGSGSVKSDFSNAGQWKKRPGEKVDPDQNDPGSE